MGIIEGTIGNAELAAAVEHAADGVSIADAAGNIRYVNPAFTALTGCSREEAVGQNPRFSVANAAAESSPAIFDEDSLLQRLMGDRELGLQVLNGFIQDAPCQLKKLRGRIDESDAGGLVLQAHTLKGSAATVGAEALRAVAQAMETAATAGQFDLCRDLMPDTVEQLERFRTRLEEDGWIPKTDLNTEIEEMCNVKA